MFTAGAKGANSIFDRVVDTYHRFDDVDRTATMNPFPRGSLEWLLYEKCWVDAVQWHLEDIIRDPQIDPARALEIKRRIDYSNQVRTDSVEQIDCYLRDKYKDVCPDTDAKLNTETPAWAIDRLSILALKIYHMRRETMREDASEAHRDTCRKKLDVLLAQREELSTSIDELIDDIAHGRKRMTSYRQMKMYNDPALNPVLYGGNR